MKINTKIFIPLASPSILFTLFLFLSCWAECCFTRKPDRKSDRKSDRKLESNMQSMIKEAIENAEVNDVDERGDTLLMDNLRLNNVDGMKRLLEAGANPNIGDLLGMAIEKAMRDPDTREMDPDPDTEIVKLLLEYGAKIVFDKKWKSDAILIAQDHKEETGNPILLNLLLSHLARIGQVDHAGLSPIHWACRDNHLAVVESILKENPTININDREPHFHFTPLHWAARRGYKEIVELLLSKGADKTAVSRSGFTPLQLAITNGHTALRELLSPDGCEIKTINLNHDWKCPICLKRSDHELPIVPLACGHRFDFICITEHLDRQGKLIREGKLEVESCPICQVELSQEEIDNFKKVIGYYFFSHFSLCDAVYKGDLPRVKYLLEHGGNANEMSLTGSPLIKAVDDGHVEISELLLQYDADPDAKTSSNSSTPLYKAALRTAKYPEEDPSTTKIIVALIKHGALVNKGSSNMYPPQQFCRRGYDVLKEAGGISSKNCRGEFKPAFGLSGIEEERAILDGR